MVLELKSLLSKAVFAFLTQNYFLEELTPLINDLDERVQEVEQRFVRQPLFLQAFNQFNDPYRNLAKDLVHLNGKLCYYLDTNNTDKQIARSLNSVHEKVVSFRNVLDITISKKIDAHRWNEVTIKKVHRLVSLSTIVLDSIIVFVTILPMKFIIVVGLIRWRKSKQLTDKDAAEKNGRVDDESSLSWRLNRFVFSVPFLWFIRLVYSWTMLSVIVLSLTTVVPYALDVLLHGTCRTAHDDPPLIISLLNGNRSLLRECPRDEL